MVKRAEINMITNPATNLMLQGRFDKQPIRRGITRVKELREGMEFLEAWNTRIESTYSGETIFIIGKEHLIQSKKLAGRPQDLLDIEKLIKVDDIISRGQA